MNKILSIKTEKRTIEIAGSAPDIDTDILSEGKDDLTQYLISKYGSNHICQVTNYGEIKIKSGLKDLVKLNGLDFKESNYLTATLPKKAADDLKNRTELFQYANETPPLKDYIKKNVNVINDLFLFVNSYRNTGKHAAAVIQTPNKDEDGNPMEIWDWFPVKRVDGNLVSEWTGDELDKLGFLKNDFLGLNQLDKFKVMQQLVKKNYDVSLELGNIPLEDEKTYFYFQEGYTQDIFQFSGDGMTSFLIDLAPDKFDDLIAANALYRPGSMDYAHTFAQLKRGEKIPQYIEGTEEALKETLGLMIYQESTMSLAIHYAGFTGTEADDLRKAVGKKLLDLMKTLKDKFFNGAKLLNRNASDTERLWNMIEQTASYQFNKSHSAAYSMLGYTTMYVKANYPLAFYVAALQFAKDDTRPKIISEMNRLGEARVMQPSINESEINFKPDFNTNKIYWSLVSIKYVGEKAVSRIIEERDKKGNFYSVQDLFDRVDKRVVNKRAIQNLILSGAFDEVYGIKRESDRLGILREYYETVLKEDIPKEFEDYENTLKDHFWILKAIELTGLGVIDYKSIVPNGFDSKLLVNPIKFYQEDSRGNDVVVCGIVISAIERNSKRGKFLTMEVDHNSEVINVLIWNESYEKKQKELKSSKGKIIFVSGIIKYDNFKQNNGFQSDNKTKIEVL